jgi:hypothetical protein
MYLYYDMIRRYHHHHHKRAARAANGHGSGLTKERKLICYKERAGERESTLFWGGNSVTQKRFSVAPFVYWWAKL